MMAWRAWRAASSHHITSHHAPVACPLYAVQYRAVRPFDTTGSTSRRGFFAASAPIAATSPASAAFFISPCDGDRHHNITTRNATQRKGVDRNRSKARQGKATPPRRAAEDKKEKHGSVTVSKRKKERKKRKKRKQARKKERKEERKKRSYKCTVAITHIRYSTD